MSDTSHADDPNDGQEHSYASLDPNRMGQDSPIPPLLTSNNPMLSDVAVNSVPPNCPPRREGRRGGASRTMRPIIPRIVRPRPSAQPPIESPQVTFSHSETGPFRPYLPSEVSTPTTPGTVARSAQPLTDRQASDRQNEILSSTPVNPLFRPQSRRGFVVPPVPSRFSTTRVTSEQSEYISFMDALNDQLPDRVERPPDIIDVRTWSRLLNNVRAVDASCHRMMRRTDDLFKLIDEYFSIGSQLPPRTPLTTLTLYDISTMSRVQCCDILLEHENLFQQLSIDILRQLVKELRYSARRLLHEDLQQ